MSENIRVTLKKQDIKEYGWQRAYLLAYLRQKCNTETFVRVTAEDLAEIGIPNSTSQKFLREFREQNLIETRYKGLPPMREVKFIK